MSRPLVLVAWTLAIAGLMPLAVRRTSAAVSVGVPLPEVVLEDADGGRHRLSELQGQPVVLVHEERSAVEQNRAFKNRLAGLGKEAGTRYVALAVADVEKYNFWPARGFVKSELRRVRDTSALVWVDWAGRLRRELGVKPGQSTVVVIGADGRLLYLHAGQIAGRELDSLFELLSTLGIRRYESAAERKKG
jgi:hypothetical protein